MICRFETLDGCTQQLDVGEYPPLHYKLPMRQEPVTDLYEGEATTPCRQGHEYRLYERTMYHDGKGGRIMVYIERAP